MEVNDAMVTKLARLAKLRFNAAEQEAIKNDLEKMISFVQKMNEVDTSNIEPLQHMALHQNGWRADVVTGSCTKTDALKNAGKYNNDFFMVPKVIKK
ncbi:MAG: Asp-tRNA(Asn)/Glu-tRNA(Gln) amidotransferase subunit GatC [Rhizobacter sp.]|nr:Asp-tRNA(Asn)/Glu-tRNA(Gln) amidotransferase subunit GatC [Ferruginibacter sp.]